MNPILYSVSKNKCPRCHQGDVFVHGHAYKKGFDQMHIHCSNCHLKYEKEPGFFYGAMYVSYGLTVAISITTFILTYLIYPDTDAWYHILFISIVSLFFAPLNYRWSRMIWMNMFSSFKPQKTH